MLTNGIHFDAPDFAGVLVVEAVAHAHRFGDDEVAADQADAGVVHGGVGQPHGKQPFQFQAQGSHGGHDAIERRAVGDPHVLLKGGFDAGFRQPRADLRAGTVDQDQLDAEAVEQRQIVNQGGQARAVQQFAGEHHHKGATPMGIDVRGRIAEPVDLIVGGGAGHGVSR